MQYTQITILNTLTLVLSIVQRICFFLRIGKSHTFYELKSNGEDGRGSEQGLSFGGGVRYRIPRGPMLEVNYVVTNFGVFSDIQGYSFSLQF